jgi:hypothetical protein
MKLASAGFLGLLVYAHAVGGYQRVLGRPLSVFRDDERAWLGYALFAMLLALGLSYCWALVRCRRRIELAVAALALVLLSIVVATPSLAEWHMVCSILLLILLYVYFAVLLYLAETFWMLGHLAVPVVLAAAAHYRSYGVWQKGFVIYFIFAAVVRHHWLMKQFAEIQRLDTKRRSKGPRKAYHLKFQSKRPLRISDE